MLSASGLSKAFAGRQLFSDVSLTLSKNEVLGLVGRNGCGKSTLTKIFLGLEQADDGVVTLPKGYRPGHLDQHINFTKPNLLDEACLGLPEERELETYLAEKTLFGLGFNQEDLERPPGDFSGGYQLRIQLAKCLLSEPDLLILDEPTNYLDILSIKWMRDVIKRYRGEVILITHDKEFMDSVVTHTGGIHRGQFRKIEGSTDKYYTQLLQDEEIYEKTRSNQERKKQELERFVERFRAKASKATQAQSKLKQLHKMESLDKLQDVRSLGFQFNYKSSPAKTVMKLENLQFGFTDELLIKDLNFEVKSDDRIGIIGKNGKGKTTLLNLLHGHHPLPKESTLTCHPSTKANYYQQTNRKNLDPSMTIEQEISSENPQLTHTKVRQICGAMMFPGDDAKKKISVLSGGEQSRVLLGKVIATSCNLLLLDEPTNHLDMESIEALIGEVKSFPGAVLFVTHNEDFLKRVANKLIYFKDGKTEYFEGRYRDFLDKIGWDEGEKKKIKKPKEKAVSHSKKIRPLEREVEKLENKITDLEQKVRDNEQFLTGDWEKDEEVYAVIKKRQSEIENAFTLLEKKSEELETLKAKMN